MTIKWSPLRDRHIEGESALGKVWIRLLRSGKPDSWYTLWQGQKTKWIAQEGDSIELIKEIIEEEHSRILLSKELSPT